VLDKRRNFRHCNSENSRAAKMTYSGVAVSSRQFRRARVIRFSMFAFYPRSRATLLTAALFFAVMPAAWGQNAGEQKPPEQAQKPPADTAKPADAAKEEKKKIDEFAEAARLLPGAAGQPECVWTGRRVVNLLWRDDLDTALRQLELYDRFGCPGDHLQQAFRCVVRQGEIDKKSTDSIGMRVAACWLTPSLPPVIAAPANGTPPAPSSQ
jgi:hypothetical protein